MLRTTDLNTSLPASLGLHLETSVVPVVPHDSWAANF